MNIIQLIEIVIVTAIILAILRNFKSFLFFSIAIFIAYFLVCHTHILSAVWHLIVALMNGLVHLINKAS
jgi:hypothetical protein